ncbi:hypothetical protein TRIUR3_26167 [Triticum urartu]|uniref:Uncharacterized protein n=1 Tax=Triticum urartu TaxID=4572 RepID=M8APU2_TRIUA|nr:hypothetical protein TRIUR3_26167 [Triticum urartu]
MARQRSGGAGIEGSRGNRRIRPWLEAEEVRGDGGRLCSAASEDDATAQPGQSSDGAGGLRAGSGAVRAQCWGRRRCIGVREAAEGREGGGGDGDRDRALGSGGARPNELEVDVGVRSVQNDEHLAELGKMTKEFIERLEARN